MKDSGGTIRRWLLNFSFFNFRIEHKPGKELVDADHISRQTNLPPATPSERLETQELTPPTLSPTPWTSGNTLSLTRTTTACPWTVALLVSKP